MKNNNWFETKVQKPEGGLEVLGYHPAWVDEDFNPDGIRVCWLDNNGENEWTSVKWDNDQDSYHTHSPFWCKDHGGTDFEPTHWMYKPKFITPTSVNQRLSND